MDDNPDLSGDQTWRQAQKKAFGRRLTWAREEKSGYSTGADYIAAMQKDYGRKLVPTTYYSHEAGDRIPRDRPLLDFYARTLNTTVEFLLFGIGEPKYVDKPEDDETSINQTPDPFYVNTSQTGSIRYIPLLTASDIKALLTGQGNLQTMSGESLPVPQLYVAGPHAISYQLPLSDTSMVSQLAPSFPPGTFLAVERDRDILPGDFLLALPADMAMPILRRFQSVHPYVKAAPRYPFKLIALSPHAEPLLVESAADCIIIGRLVWTAQPW